MKKETRALLKSRAAAMAREPEQQNRSSRLLEIISFTLAEEMYSIESAYVREVIPIKDFTPLPGVPSHIYGLINVRGQILPVINLKKFFNLTEQRLGELNKVIILQNEDMEFGILADVVHGMQQTGVEEIRAVPATISSIREKYLLGVTTEHLIILNAKKLLSDESIMVNEEVN